MLHNDQRNAWHGRERAVPISTVLNFSPDGLVLGAGTVLLRAEGARRLQALTGREARILALLLLSAKPAENGKPVSFDDCEQATGTILFEIKGEGVAKLTKDLRDIMADRFIDQATRQMQASGGRSMVWIFAEEGAALFARKLFDDEGLEGISVAHIPWTRNGR